MADRILRRVLVKNIKKEPQLQKESSFKSPTVEEAVDDTGSLSGSKPFFDVVLSKSNVCPRCCLTIPQRFIGELPRAKVPVILRYSGRKWCLEYQGDASQPKFDGQWREFVTDNNLTVGDACVFELLEFRHTILKFKVLILRGQLPPELQEVIDARGTSKDPIVLN